MRTRALIFLGILFSTLLISACAHDPDPFAREESYEEKENRENQQTLQARERNEELHRRNIEAARQDNAQESSESDASTVQDPDAQEDAQAASRAAARDAAASARRIDIPRMPGTSLPGVSPVLSR